MRLIASAMVALVLAGCLMGCNATQAQIEAFRELTAITVQAAKDSGVAVQANVRLSPVGGRIVEGFELYGLDVNASILANPAAGSPTTVTVLPATVTP